jgi:hypothetical protein
LLWAVGSVGRIGDASFVRGLLPPILVAVTVVALALALACGRIGFDLARDDGADDVAAPPLDAEQEPADGDADLGDANDVRDASDLSDAVAACGWQPCATGSDACCVAGAGMCVATGTCSGAVYACDNSAAGRCDATKKCCMLPGGGSLCINLNTICGEPM